MRDLEVLWQDTDDAELAYRKTGSGPALLLVHGFPLSGLTWAGVLPALSRHFTCYAVDLAGAGDARWTKATDFGFRAQARRLAIFLERLGIASCSVMAHDTGATIARQLALIEPGRVKKLVLSNTELPHHRPPWIPQYQVLMRLPGTPFFFRQLLKSRAFLRSTLGFGGCFVDLDRLDGDFHRDFVEPLLHSDVRMEGMKQYLCGIDWDLVDEMADRHSRINIPVQLLWGEDDTTFPIKLAREVVKQFPDARLEAIPGAKLLVHDEKADVVAEKALSFLQA